MASLFNIATSGLIAFQQALNTTGNNIANVDTEGYSRQTVEFAPRPTDKFGNFYLGTGVSISNVQRNADEFVNSQVRQAVTLDGNLTTTATQLQRLDVLLGDTGKRLTSAIQDFFGGFHELVERPDDTAVRATLLGSSNQLTNRFHIIKDQIDFQTTHIREETRGIVEKINTLAIGIAKLNTKIVGGTTVSHELLDTRDRLITELSEYVGVFPITQDDGSINLMMGNGQALVLAGETTPLALVNSAEDVTRFSLVLKKGTSNFPVPPSFLGGRLGGLMDFQDGPLQEVMNHLGRIAIALSETVNTQHQLGMDLNGVVNKDFFKDMNTTQFQQARSTSNQNNTGTGVLRVQISDVTKLEASNYNLVINAGPSYSLHRLSDDTKTTFTTFPHTVDGLTIHLDSGTLNTNDRFLLTPVRNGSRDIGLSVATPAAIAVASPIRTQSLQTNTGSGAISAGYATDTATTAFSTTPGQLTPPIRVEFLSKTTYQLVNITTSAVIEGSITYDPTLNNEIFPTPAVYDPGYRVALSGNPETGDKFTINFNSSGIGDNRNALAITGLQTKKILEGSTSSIESGYASLVTTVASQTSQAKLSLETSSTLKNQAEARRDNLSGVNLDEEAANLLKYEQAYQAMTKSLSIMQELFGFLLTSLQ